MIMPTAGVIRLDHAQGAELRAALVIEVPEQLESIFEDIKDGFSADEYHLHGVWRAFKMLSVPMALIEVLGWSTWDFDRADAFEIPATDGLAAWLADLLGSIEQCEFGSLPDGASFGAGGRRPFSDETVTRTYTILRWLQDHVRDALLACDGTGENPVEEVSRRRDQAQADTEEMRRLMAQPDADWSQIRAGAQDVVRSMTRVMEIADQKIATGVS